MSDDTVSVDGEEYIFPPNQVVKPEKEESEESLTSKTGEDRTKEKSKHQKCDKETEVTQSKLEQRKERISEEDKGKVIWTGGRIQ